MPNGLTSNRCCPSELNVAAHRWIGGASWMPSCMSSSVAARDAISPPTSRLGKRSTTFSGNGRSTTSGPPSMTRCARWSGKLTASAVGSRPPFSIARASSPTVMVDGWAMTPASGSKGRKRHLLVDTLGLVLGVAVTPASTTERDGAQQVLGRVLGWFTWLRILWVDGGYTGATFAQWVQGLRPKLAVTVVKRSDATVGFKGLPRRCVVARTFGRLMRQWRRVRDYETTESIAEAWIYIAMIRIQLRRLA